MNIYNNNLKKIPSYLIFIITKKRQKYYLIQQHKLAHSIDREACDIFQGYFEVQEHKTKTRNNQCLLKLPKIKTEYACKSFASWVLKCVCNTFYHCSKSKCRRYL